MIKTDIIKINFTNDNEKIEAELAARGIEPLRWAVTEVKEDEISVCVSFEV